MLDLGVQQKQFLVKYRGLAHVHNHWVPEKQLLLENPFLGSNFLEKDQVIHFLLKSPSRMITSNSIFCIIPAGCPMECRLDGATSFIGEKTYTR